MFNVYFEKRKSSIIFPCQLLGCEIAKKYVKFISQPSSFEITNLFQSSYLDSTFSFLVSTSKVKFQAFQIQTLILCLNLWMLNCFNLWFMRRMFHISNLLYSDVYLRTYNRQFLCELVKCGCQDSGLQLFEGAKAGQKAKPPTIHSWPTKLVKPNHFYETNGHQTWSCCELYRRSSETFWELNHQIYQKLAPFARTKFLMNPGTGHQKINVGTQDSSEIGPLCPDQISDESY